jgi:hypothetical protein
MSWLKPPKGEERNIQKLRGKGFDPSQNTQNGRSHEPKGPIQEKEQNWTLHGAVDRRATSGVSLIFQFGVGS